MTLPTIVGVGTYAAGTGAIVPGLPSGWAADDIHYLFVEQSGVNTLAWTYPSGWALVTGLSLAPGTAATDPGGTVLWRRAVAGDTAPTVPDTINHTGAFIVGVRGAITTGDPWDVISSGTDTGVNTSATIPGATTTVADCLVLAFCFHGVDALAGVDVFTAWTNADLGSFAELTNGDQSTSLGNGGGQGVASGTKAAAGAYGNTTVTLSNASTKAYGTIATKPPAVTGYTETLELTITSTVDSTDTHNTVAIVRRAFRPRPIAATTNGQAEPHLWRGLLSIWPIFNQSRIGPTGLVEQSYGEQPRPAAYTIEATAPGFLHHTPAGRAWQPSNHAGTEGLLNPSEFDNPPTTQVTVMVILADQLAGNMNGWIVGQLNSWTLGLATAGSKINMRVDTGSQANSGDSVTSFNDGLPRVVFGRYDGVNVEIWVDGVKENSAAKTGALANTTANLSLGQEVGGFNRLNALINMVGVWNRAISDEEIALLTDDPFRLFDASEDILQSFTPVVYTETLEVTIASTVTATDRMGFKDNLQLTVASTVTATDRLDANEALEVTVASTVTATNVLKAKEALELSIASTLTVTDVLKAKDALEVSIASTVDGTDVFKGKEALEVSIISTVDGTDALVGNYDEFLEISIVSTVDATDLLDARETLEVSIVSTLDLLDAQGWTEPPLELVITSTTTVTDREGYKDTQEISIISASDQALDRMDYNEVLDFTINATLDGTDFLSGGPTYEEHGLLVDIISTVTATDRGTFEDNNLQITVASTTTGSDREGFKDYPELSLVTTVTATDREAHQEPALSLDIISTFTGTDAASAYQETSLQIDIISTFTGTDHLPLTMPDGAGISVGAGLPGSSGRTAAAGSTVRSGSSGTSSRSGSGGSSTRRGSGGSTRKSNADGTSG